VTELRDYAARRASGDMSETEFRSQFSALLSRVPPQTIRESAFFSLPANKPPWFDTGIECRAGEEITVFAAGRAYLSRELDIWLKPSFWLWYRLGEQGELFRGTRFPIRLPLPLAAIYSSPVRFLESGRRGLETCPLRPRSISRRKAGS